TLTPRPTPPPGRIVGMLGPVGPGPSPTGRRARGTGTCSGASSRTMVGPAITAGLGTSSFGAGVIGLRSGGAIPGPLASVILARPCGGRGGSRGTRGFRGLGAADGAMGAARGGAAAPAGPAGGWVAGAGASAAIFGTAGATGTTGATGETGGATTS